MDMTRRRDAIGNESGQALIEMAVALPAFFLLLFGIFAFSFVLFGWCDVTFDTRGAVRYASIHSNTALVPATPTTVAAAVAQVLFANQSTTTVTYSGSNPASAPVGGSSPFNTIGGTVVVSVTATYSVVMPFTNYTTFTVASSAQRTISR
jgi:Flp pilus assembly protein TadG